MSEDEPKLSQADKDFIREATAGLSQKAPDAAEKELLEQQRKAKNKLLLKYLNQYFIPRSLRDIPSEAWRMKTTFPVWKSIEEKRPDVEDMEILNLIEIGDIEQYAQYQVGAHEGHLRSLLIGTEPYRHLQQSQLGWKKIVQIAETAMDPGFGNMHGRH